MLAPAVTATGGAGPGGTEPVGGGPGGTLCLVLHSHLPWVAHAGSWPVGEEWLYQAWAASYLPVVALLRRLAEEGRTGVLTLGVTPVLAAMLDDPYCLRGFHTWLGTWLARAEGALVRGVPVAAREAALARAALEEFETGWVHGASPLLRALADAGVVELLGGPAAHPFTPLLPDRVAAGALGIGLEDAAVRLGRRPVGIWAPECGYRPGLEQVWLQGGVGHLVVDGPAVHGRTHAPVDVAGSGLVAFPRDLEVTYRVWSPRSGYPGGRWYRDFHTFDHPSGLRPARVTSRRLPPAAKAPYDPAAAAAAVRRDAAEFVGTVVRRMRSLPEPRLVVCAFDTELFGHWWHEGPDWLEEVLRVLPQAGVRLATLADAAQRLPARPAELPPSSWGSGKDWRVWQVPEFVDLGRELCALLLDTVDASTPARQEPGRAAVDQLARECLLGLASDWAFCVAKDSAADYARSRAHGHAERARALAAALRCGDRSRVERLTRSARALDYPFGRLDALAAFAPARGPAGRGHPEEAGGGPGGPGGPDGRRWPAWPERSGVAGGNPG